MNAQRRKLIAEALNLLKEAQEKINDAGQDERDAYENLPEGIQASERGEKMDEIAAP